MFSGFAEHVAGPGKSQDHGCYLLNANGHIRSPQNDMSKSNPSVRFYTNSIIEMTFKPFHKLLVINRVIDVLDRVGFDSAMFHPARFAGELKTLLLC